MALIQHCEQCSGSGVKDDQPCPACAGTGYDVRTVVANKKLPNGEGERP